MSKPDPIKGAIARLEEFSLGGVCLLLLSKQEARDVLRDDLKLVLPLLKAKHASVTPQVSA
jgi:hypothetical protein